MDFSKLHWYSDNEDYSIYSIIDFPNIILHIDMNTYEILKVDLINELS